MIETYTVRYRQPGQWLWRRVRNVRGDGVEPGQFRWLALADDSLLYLSLQAEVRFPPARAGHGMVGSGMFVINPPFGLADEAARLARLFAA